MTYGEQWNVLPACLGAAFIYALSTLGYKYVYQGGAKTKNVLLVTNISRAFLVQVLWLFPHETPAWNQIYLPIADGILGFLALWCASASLQWGDASIAAPLLGLKILCVPILSLVLYAVPLPNSIWFAAILSVVGTVVLGMSPSGHVALQNRVISAVFALAAAVIYSFCDVTSQRWAPAFGREPFIIISGVTMAICSLPFVIPAKAAMQRTPSVVGIKKGMAWGIIAAALAMNIQSIVYFLVLVHGRDNAAFLNILYGSRLVWTVVLVAAFAGLLGLVEQQAGKWGMTQRLAGSFLIISAIFVIA